MTDIRSTPQWDTGRDGARLIEQWFRSHRFLVHVACDHDDDDAAGAPALESDDAFIALPDLDVAGGGSRRYVEVKTKSKALWVRIRERYEHGISARQLRNYWRVQQETGCDVWICIYQLDAGAVLLAKLDDLAHCEWHYGDMKKGIVREGRMVNFPKSAFTQVARICSVDGRLGEQMQLEPAPKLPF